MILWKMRQLKMLIVTIGFLIMHIIWLTHSVKIMVRILLSSLSTRCFVTSTAYTGIARESNWPELSIRARKR